MRRHKLVNSQYLLVSGSYFLISCFLSSWCLQRLVPVFRFFRVLRASCASCASCPTVSFAVFLFVFLSIRTMVVLFVLAFCCLTYPIIGPI